MMPFIEMGNPGRRVAITRILMMKINLICLLNIQIELWHRQLVKKDGVQGKGQVKDINLRVICTYIDNLKKRR